MSADFVLVALKGAGRPVRLVGYQAVFREGWFELLVETKRMLATNHGTMIDIIQIGIPRTLRKRNVFFLVSGLLLLFAGGSLLFRGLSLSLFVVASFLLGRGQGFNVGNGTMVGTRASVFPLAVLRGLAAFLLLARFRSRLGFLVGACDGAPVPLSACVLPWLSSLKQRLDLLRHDLAKLPLAASSDDFPPPRRLFVANHCSFALAACEHVPPISCAKSPCDRRVVARKVPSGV